MSLPYYVSDTVRGWLKEVDKSNPETIYNVFGDEHIKKIVDEKTNIEHLCGIMVLKINNISLPVVVIAGHVYDAFNRIYNKEFDFYYVCMGITGIDIEKSKYFMTPEMLRFFIKNKIEFLPKGETLLDLKTRKVESMSSYCIGTGWLMT